MSGQNHAEKEEGFLSLQTLIAIIILLIYTIAAPLFEKYHFHYMHESGVCMIIGVVVTLIAMVINPHVKIHYNFNSYILSQIFQTHLNLVRKCFSHGFYLRLYLPLDII